MPTPSLRSRPSFPLVIAHRGARGHAPENTLAAAALGKARGADLWELDVNCTLDGQLVVMHDDTVERTTDVKEHLSFAARAPWRVCDFTLEELRGGRLRGLDAGSWYERVDPFGRVSGISPSELVKFRGLPIPTLEEALRLTKKLDWRVNVEIKDHKHLRWHETVTKAVISLIRRLDMVDRVLLSSFRHQYLEQARVLLPELATGALVEDVRPQNPVELCRRLGAAAYHPDRRILASGDLEALADAGFAVNVWTVNDPDEAERLVRHGASGIITDFPGECLARLRETGLRTRA